MKAGNGIDSAFTRMVTAHFIVMFYLLENPEVLN
jgi:hypothetical protein